MAMLRMPLVRVALAWLVLAAILLIRSWQGIAESRFPDPDDVLRLVQVRDLLAGQGWLDLHQYRIDGPSGTLMHWSRVVDIPLVLVIGSLTPLLGAASAEQVAIVFIPLLTLGAIIAAVSKIASRYLDDHGVLFAWVSLGLSSLLMAQVQPLRIDHHGWQVFTVMLALTGLVPGRGARGPVLAGAALAAGLSISLEVLPIAAAFGAVFALRWLFQGNARAPLVAFLGALAATLAALFLTTRGLGDLAQHCDAVSPALLGLFAIAAGGTTAVAWFNPRSRLLAVALLAASAVAAAGFYLWQAPQCAAGPFGNLDPLVREFWYENVLEGRPVWFVPLKMWLPLAAQGVIALGVLTWLSMTASGDERRWWAEYLLIAVVALATGLLVWRSMAFVGAISAVPLGWLLARMFKALGKAERPLRKVAIAAAMMIVLVPALPIAAAGAILPATMAAERQSGTAGDDACLLTDSAAGLNRLPAATIFAPLDLGPALLYYSDHSVIATAHHRAQLAMRDVIAAFLGSPDRAREIVQRHNARYVLLCTSLVETRLYAKKSPQGFAAQLLGGHEPDWLERIPLEGTPEVQLWRVKASGPK